MQAVTVTIGRNRRPESTVEPNTALPETSWAGFVGAVRDALDHYLAVPGSWIEVHYGVGEWDGVREESAKVTITGDHLTLERLPWVRNRLGRVAVFFDQDAIALHVGQSDLVTARTHKRRARVAA